MPCQLCHKTVPYVTSRSPANRKRRKASEFCFVLVRGDTVAYFLDVAIYPRHPRKWTEALPEFFTVAVALLLQIS